MVSALQHGKPLSPTPIFRPYPDGLADLSIVLYLQESAQVLQIGFKARRDAYDIAIKSL